jgi:hypothetical protein
MLCLKCYARGRMQPRKILLLGSYNLNSIIWLTPMEYLYISYHTNIANFRLTFWNMLVSKRVAGDEPKMIDWYNLVQDEDDDAFIFGPEQEHVERHLAELKLHYRLQKEFYDSPLLYLESSHIWTYRAFVNRKIHANRY